MATVDVIATGAEAAPDWTRLNGQERLDGSSGEIALEGDIGELAIFGPQLPPSRMLALGSSAEILPSIVSVMGILEEEEGEEEEEERTETPIMILSGCSRDPCGNRTFSRPTF